MSKKWPPRTVNLATAFKPAHDAKQAPPPPTEIVTAAEIRRLENQRSKAVAVLKPAGSKQNDAADRERERRIARMKERLHRNDGKARDAFNRTNER